MDVDTGVDDAFAVLFAAMHPDINLLGITCVDGNGENRIIIIPGANHEIESAKAVVAIDSIRNLSVVVAQCEIKQEVTLAAFKAAKARGCTTILNPAPYHCLLYTSPSPRDRTRSRMPSSA